MAIPRQTSMTKKDIQYMKLRDTFRKAIKTKKDFREFINYVKVYYGNGDL